MKKGHLGWSLSVLSFSACAVLALACAEDGSDGHHALVSLVPVDPGERCANGGIEVQSGWDDNRNGQLDADEVAETTLICNGDDGIDGFDGQNGQDGNDGLNGLDGDDGTDGVDGWDGLNSLVQVTDLPLDDPDCPQGGIRIDAGFDEDADGVLDPDEIQATEFLCNATQEYPTSSLDPPAGPPGAFFIDIKGGVGMVEEGGPGGSINIELDAGSLGGHVKLFDTGVADADFTFPIVPADLGAHPLIVSADLVVPALPAGDHTGVEDGTPHTHRDDDNLYLDNADSIFVTGISVDAGVTLTFGLNTTSGTPEYDRAQIELENDFRNAGIVTTAEVERTGATNDQGGLDIICDVFIGQSGSSIDLAGPDAEGSGSDGGDGGHFGIWADSEDSMGDNLVGRLLNRGVITTSGGRGDNGGDAGDVDLHAGMGIVNTGTILVIGGQGVVSSGGRGGPFDLSTDYGDIHNSGRIDTSGGDGGQSGGRAGEIDVDVWSAGMFRNTGHLIANGGNIDPSCTTGCIDGGTSNHIFIVVNGGGITSTGDIIAHGGYGAAGHGGGGGHVELLTLSSDEGWFDEIVPARNIMLSGNIDLSGGDGDWGGPGGQLGVYLSADETPLQQEIVLLGYTDILAFGGEGVTAGGDGGTLDVLNSSMDATFPADRGPGGGIVNYVDIDAYGGDAEDGRGGTAVGVTMETDTDFGYATDAEVALNYGDIDVSGGTGTTAGGLGGHLLLWGYSRAENHGRIDAGGGDATADDGTGGIGAFFGPVTIGAGDGPAINTAPIVTSGGNATADGGQGGDALAIQIIGLSVQNAANLTAAGGDGGATGGTGGDAGTILLFGLREGTQNTAATLDVSAGSGQTPGTDGEVIIDGVHAEE